MKECDGVTDVSTQASLLCSVRVSLDIQVPRSQDTPTHRGEDGGFNSNSQAHLRVLQNKRLCKRVLNSCLWLGLHISVCSCQAALLRFTEWKKINIFICSVLHPPQSAIQWIMLNKICDFAAFTCSVCILESSLHYSRHKCKLLLMSTFFTIIWCWSQLVLETRHQWQSIDNIILFRGRCTGAVLSCASGEVADMQNQRF